MLRTGTQIMVQSLLDHGVDLVFGYPGGTILPFYDERTSFPATSKAPRTRPTATRGQRAG